MREQKKKLLQIKLKTFEKTIKNPILIWEYLKGFCEEYNSIMVKIEDLEEENSYLRKNIGELMVKCNKLEHKINILSKNKHCGKV